LAEECRDQRRTRWLEDLAQDTRYAWRTFAQSPAFTLTAVLTLALGIGANTAFFSTAYGILFRPLPYPSPDRIVNMPDGIAGMGPVVALRDISRTVDYAGCMPGIEMNLQFGGEASRIRSAFTTWNLLRVLGVHPAHGRWFTESEEFAGHGQVVMLSDRTWRRLFNADPSILGHRIILDEQSVEIIGIMPPGFAFPTPDTELWVPIRRDPRNVGAMWGGGYLWPIGRLHDGVSIAAADKELPPAIDRIRAMFPWRMPDAWGIGAHLAPRAQAEVADVRPKLFALSTAALLLLLIACGNVANLLLARTVQRDREFSMREALGARRSRLLRQLITESMLLVVAGGITGLAAAAVILRFLPLLLPKDTPRISEIGLHPAVLISAAASMLLTVLLFGAAPLFRLWTSTRQSLIGRAVTSTRHSSRLSLALIAAELALATTLLIAAGLMGRTLWQLANVDAGLHATGITSAQVSAGPSRCPNPDRCLALLRDINQTLLTLPETRSVNWSNVAPLSKDYSAVAIEIRDLPKPPGAPAYVDWQTTATPGYFHALGIPLLAGRLFTDSDRIGSLPVMLVSASTAKHYWPHESALGKKIRPMSDTEWRTVVGVVGDVAQYSLTGFPNWVDGVQYLPLAQSLPRTASNVKFTLFVESAQPPTVSALTAAVRQHFPDVVVSHIQPLEAIRADSITDQRSTAWLLTLFALLGLLLGVAGVYGVISHRAAQRTREIGIRLALGASANSVIGMVLQETLLISVVGIAAGAAMAFWLSRFLQSLLFGVTTHDSLTLTLCPTILLLAALLAAALPGWRASRIDPCLTLREE
jgi:predicted permease